MRSIRPAASAALAMSPPAASTAPGMSLRNRSTLALGRAWWTLCAPGFEHRLAERHVILARLGRHVVADEGLDRRLVGADAIDVGGDAELVEQSLEIEVRAARPGERHRAERVEPDLRSRGRELVAVVGIADRISDHRLARRADARIASARSPMAVCPPPWKPSRSSATALTRLSVLGLVERRDQVAKRDIAAAGCRRRFRRIGPWPAVRPALPLRSSASTPSLTGAGRAESAP